MTKIFLLLSCTLLAISSFATSNYTKEQMKRELQFVADTYRTGYAPYEWKNKHIGWDLDQQLTEALGKVDAKGDITVSDYHKILKDFFRSTQDYHVGFRFYATESSRLPFSVKSAEGKYFIAHINRSRLSQTAFPFNVGDELVEFDGRAVADVVSEIASQNGMGVPRTDRGIAELLLTSRSAARAMDVPRGVVELGIKKAGAENLQHIQLIWEYTPESVTYPQVKSSSVNMFSSNKESFGFPVKKDVLSPIKNTQMSLFGWEDLIASEDSKAEDQNPFAIGGRESYVPKLGKIVWESTKDNHYHAYIYKNTEGKLIGYIRIAHYGAGGPQFTQFKEIIEKYEDLTDALVIDQINNPGGSVFYIYALMSVLSDKIVYTPQHHIRIYPEHIAEASNLLKQMESIKDEEQAKKELGSEWGGYPVTYQTVEYLKEYARFILAEWNKGKTLTSPNYIWGVDKVNPHNDVNYTKPILVLTNELDFSGGDFFPAILQDNKRAKIMGIRTAGAGGYVISTGSPSALGLSNYSFTGSLAKRINDQPIENLGVTPDIEYDITETDIKYGFADYGEAINKALNDMMGVKTDKSEDNKEDNPVDPPEKDKKDSVEMP